MISFNEFCKLHHSITLLGMSGIGKTILSTSIRDSGNWFHYSADYRIGTRYLSEQIIDNVKFKIMQMKDRFVAELLMSDSIYINHNISVNDLRPVSTFLGMYGDSDLGGLAKNTFLARQELYRSAEISSMLDISHFIHKAWNIYQCPNFINDASGSLCEIIDSNDPNDVVLNELIGNTLILYVEADEEAEENLIERARSRPKPLFYNPGFIGPILKEMPADGKGIAPIDFARELFPSLLNYRKPIYNNIGEKYGITISMKDLFWSNEGKGKVPDSLNFLKNIYQALEVQTVNSNLASNRFELYLEICTQREEYRKKKHP